MSKIVMDIDGIFTDIWSGVEKNLRKRAKTANYADSDIPELPDLASYLAFKSEHGYSQNGFTEQAFLRNFRFDGYVTDYNLSSIPETERKLVFAELANPELFENPEPMYYQVNKAKHPWVWADVQLFPVHINTLIQHERIPYSDMLPWFVKFCVTNGHTIEMHSVVYTAECEKARRSWFEREIKPFDTDGVLTLKLDCGEKSQIVGDLVIEDCLENLLKSDTCNRVLFNTFHNGYSSTTNQLIAAHYAGINPDTQKIVCVSNFDDVVEVLNDFNNILHGAVDPKFGTVSCVYDMYTAMRDKRGVTE